MPEIAEGSIWIHSKTRNEYSILLEAFDEATSARLVIYKSLTNGSVWARPRVSFMAKFEPLIREAIGE